MGQSENDSARYRLLFMLSLTALFFLIEITVGYVTNSMALVADSFHMLSDVIALVIAYVSVRMSPKKWSKNTFGWARAEVLGALVNAVFLCALCFSILVESVKRFYKPETIHDPHIILVVGVTGLVINVIGLFLFRDSGGHGHSHGGGGHGHSHGPAAAASGGHSHAKPEHSHGHQHLHVDGDVSPNLSREASPDPLSGSVCPGGSDDSGSEKAIHVMSSQQMNMRGVFLHVLADALGSVIVCISACVIMYVPIDWIVDNVDPTLSVLMVCLIIWSTWGLLVESAMILLQTVPTHIQIDSLQRKLLQEIDGVLAVHEFHVWQLAGDRIIASAHIRCHNLHDYMQIAEKVKEFFHNEGIHSTTIQPEFVDLENEFNKLQEDEMNCVLDCPKKTGNCVNQTCCGPQQGKESSHDSSPNLVKRSKANSQNELNSAAVDFVEVAPSDRSKSRSAEDMV